MTPQYISLVLKFLVLLLWCPTAAWAATVTLNQTLSSINGGTLFLIWALSSLSGATALVWRVDKELRAAPGAKLPLPWLFASAHMLGSWLAGVLAFLICESQNMDDWFELGAIVCASFMGAKFIELVAEKYLARMLPPPKDNP